VEVLLSLFSVLLGLENEIISSLIDIFSMFLSL
jgi:hypothetical protein